VEHRIRNCGIFQHKTSTKFCAHFRGEIFFFVGGKAPLPCLPFPDVLWYISKGVGARNIKFATLFNTKRTQNFRRQSGRKFEMGGGRATDLNVFQSRRVKAAFPSSSRQRFISSKCNRSELKSPVLKNVYVFKFEKRDNKTCY